jgi:hypothetical protein
VSIGEKIADAIPDSLIEYLTEHPTVLCAGTFALTVLTCALFETAIRLDVRACDYRKARIGQAQRAASEALGG